MSNTGQAESWENGISKTMEIVDALELGVAGNQPQQVEELVKKERPMPAEDVESQAEASLE